ncbi:MAG TPA: UDP-N-acetylmuramoyl-L-alanyl-D-glutamate--2,6-diaminopimelate ligase [Candidatus Aquilonibacter sp.]|nr:UDP-N-acetylmuramoyl-L-alanyl-D-glutamate--2,6-diaminopimelate ligase [Candidatus Aquilonibacter sp.]
MKLSALLARLPASTQVTGDRDVEISSLEIDSRRVKPGALFVAVPGEHVDGHEFVNAALKNGAAAVVAQSGRRIDATPACLVYVPDTRRALSTLAAGFYGDPSRAMDVIGVTGTNGKTTTTHMIASILKKAGRRCGIIGTVGGYYDRFMWELSNTTPLPPELHALLAEMRERGADSIAMEVSSHALALERVEDVRFRVGVFTNLTRDHLDFHQTFEAYAAAKHRLFTMCEAAVINVDDEHGARWAAETRHKIPTITYSLRGDADVVARDIEIDSKESRFTVDGTAMTLLIPGRFNVANALAAIGVARHLGIGDDVVEQALWTIENVPGRMEYVGDNIVHAIVDYAHTPDALYQALWALREATSGVALVFGCGGDRDKGKRAEMGRIAAQHARRIYVTSDNPRTEDPMAIIADIEAGIGSHPHVVEPDRKRAIERAIDESQPGEIVLIAGKGHEKYQIVGTQVLPFDDSEVARAAIRARRTRV